jgi:hypothetical protein
VGFKAIPPTGEQGAGDSPLLSRRSLLELLQHHRTTLGALTQERERRHRDALRFLLQQRLLQHTPRSGGPCQHERIHMGPEPSLKSGDLCENVVGRGASQFPLPPDERRLLQMLFDNIPSHGALLGTASIEGEVKIPTNTGMALPPRSQAA